MSLLLEVLLCWWSGLQEKLGGLVLEVGVKNRYSTVIECNEELCQIRHQSAALNTSVHNNVHSYAYV